MTGKLQEALKQVETWPEEVQDELADAAAGPNLKGDYQATEEELVGIDRGLDDVREGRFSTDDEVRTTFGRFRHA